jgi:hypothetical protein
MMLQGWAIVGWAAAVVGGATLMLLADGVTEAALHRLLRVTAELSLVFFLLAFTASSLRRAWPARPTAWLLANRRYLGVSMGVSHAVHGLVIGTLAGWSWAGYLQLGGPVTAAVGGLGFVALLAMVATSFDTTAAWLGPRSWRRLHLTGAHLLWFIFVATLAPRLPTSAESIVPVSLLVTAMAVRLRWRGSSRAG